MIFNLFNKNENVISDRIVNYFFIDYENVNEKGLDGIEKLEKGDVLYVFHNNTTSKLPIGLAKILFALPEIGIEVKNIEINHTGKNALDMILAANIGWAIAENQHPKVRFNIISKDRGLGSLVDNLEGLLSINNCEGEYLFNKAPSILSCYVEVTSSTKQSKKTKAVKKEEPKENKKPKETKKKEPVKKAEETKKKEPAKKTEQVTNDTSKQENKPVKKETKKTASKSKKTKSNEPTKQEKSTTLQHDDQYKETINNIRKKLVSEGKLNADEANKVANSITGVIVKTKLADKKYEIYTQMLTDAERDAVKSVEKEVKYVFNTYFKENTNS